jgi:hypothetical protein
MCANAGNHKNNLTVPCRGNKQQWENNFNLLPERLEKKALVCTQTVYAGFKNVAMNAQDIPAVCKNDQDLSLGKKSKTMQTAATVSQHQRDKGDGYLDTEWSVFSYCTEKKDALSASLSISIFNSFHH